MRDLAMILEQLKDFASPLEALEQYRTPGDLAARILWEAYLRGDLEGSTVIDLGCGTGVLSYGSLALDAESALCIDVDQAALETARENLKEFEGFFDLVAGDVKALPVRPLGDCVVIMNPPFGVKRRGADLVFLKQALRTCGKVYSIHKYSPESVKLIERVAENEGFGVTLMGRALMNIKQRLRHHRRRVHRFEVALFRFERLQALGDKRERETGGVGTSGRSPGGSGGVPTGSRDLRARL